MLINQSWQSEFALTSKYIWPLRLVCCWSSFTRYERALNLIPHVKNDLAEKGMVRPEEGLWLHLWVNRVLFYEDT